MRQTNPLFTIHYLLLTILFLSSCLPQPTSAPVESFAVQNTQAPVFTAIPTLTVRPPETPTIQVVPFTDTPPPVSTHLTTTIIFPTNGTYVDIEDSIPQGSSKAYSISAMEGQIMTLSILPYIFNDEWAYFTMQVQTADGTTLCPTDPDQECNVFRGVLPATQDYLVTVSARGTTNTSYTMRVAINPPGQATQYFQHTNTSTGLSMVYPDSFVPATSVPVISKISPDFSLNYLDKTLYAKTNLANVYLMIGSSLDPSIVSTCVKPIGDYEQMIDSQIVNDINFFHSQIDDAGAGNFYEQQIYRAVKGSVCYEIIFYLHSSNIYNFAPEMDITQFNRENILDTLFDVLATVQIK